MKGLLITPKGMEDIASLEVKELIGKSSKKEESCIVFEIKKYEELFELCYKSQSALGIFYLLHEFNYSSIFNDFKKNLKKIKLDDWLTKDTKFRVTCMKNQGNNTQTPDLEKKFGELIIEYINKKHSYKQPVDLENPDITLFFYLTKNKCYIGIDFTGIVLRKRSYKIFANPSDIPGTIGYYIIRLSDFKINETLIDPFAGSGTLPIEAALFTSKFPINYYNKDKFNFLKLNKFKNFDFTDFFHKIDKNIANKKLKIHNIDSSMKNINSSKKNSKIAGIEKIINFSMTSIEWLDTKFDEGSIDKITSKMPSLKQKDIENVYNEFFYQSEFILKKQGSMVLIGDQNLIKKYSSKYKFKISKQLQVFSGKMGYNVFVLNK